MTQESHSPDSNLGHSPLDEIRLPENPEERCAVLLLCDTSGSMYGGPIEKLNEGLSLFCEVTKADSIANNRVELAIISFADEIRVQQPFAGPPAHAGIDP